MRRAWQRLPRFPSAHRDSSTQSNPWRTNISDKNASVNAFVYVADAPAGEASLPLHGAAIAIKNNISTVSMPTSCSSNMLKEYTSGFDATVVDLLRKSGADIVGKTNCDEFGMGSLNTHSIHGPVINPFQPTSSSVPWADREKRSAGGSSGGSAAAVAAGMCHAALATDTGGSTRLPASYCGIVGLKPSYGLISRWGVVSFADSLDCVGVMAASVSETKRIFDLISTYDEKDPTSAGPDCRQNAALAAQEATLSWGPASTGQINLNGLRIGIPQEYFPSELSPAILGPVRRIVASLKERGASVIPVSLPSTSYALSAYYVIASAEASSNMARYDGVQFGLHIKPPPGADLTKTSNIYAYTRSIGFGHEVQKRILLGTYALTAHAFDNYFLQAQRVRQLVKDDFNRVFRLPDFLSSPSVHPEAKKDGVDVLIHPSAIRTAPPLSVPDSSGIDSYVQDVLTVPASLAGLPALNVPARSHALNGESSGDGWPVGVSIVGQWGCDEMVLRVGGIIEELESGLDDPQGKQASVSNVRVA